MAKSDWTITGDGGLSIVEIAGSKRCRLTHSKLMLWNGNTNLTDCEVIVDTQVYNNGNYAGGIVLRSNSTATTCYRLLIVGTTTSRTYYIQKKVNGQTTTLSSAPSTKPYTEYVKIRFRVDGFQLSVEEWTNGDWELISMAQDTSQAISSGSIGLFGESASSSYSITFDNFECNIKI